MIDEASNTARSRIAIDGAQCTGKTSLLDQLRNVYSGRLRFIPEASRIVAPRFSIFSHKHWKPVLADAQLLANFFKMEEEWLMQQELPGRFVVDSSLMLIQAYKLYFGHAKDESLLRQDRYDLILYCPPTNTFVADGFRFPTGRLKVDELYRQILRDYFRGRVLELPVGAERLPAAIAAIANALE